jgi:hypothetical protein
MASAPLPPGAPSGTTRKDDAPWEAGRPSSEEKEAEDAGPHRNGRAVPPPLRQTSAKKPGLRPEAHLLELSLSLGGLTFVPALRSRPETGRRCPPRVNTGPYGCAHRAVRSPTTSLERARPRRNPVRPARIDHHAPPGNPVENALSLNSRTWSLTPGRLER